MAELGFRTVNEMIGQVDSLAARENIMHWKYRKLDLSPIFIKNPARYIPGCIVQEEQDHGLEEVLDWKLLEAAKPALENREKVYREFNIKNTRQNSRNYSFKRNHKKISRRRIARMIPFISNSQEQQDKALLHSIQKGSPWNWKVMPMIILEKD